MQSFLNILATLVLAIVVIAGVMLAMTMQRIRRLRWRAIESRPVAVGDIPEATYAVLQQPAEALAQRGFEYRYSVATDKAVVDASDTPGYFQLYAHADGKTLAMVSTSPVPETHAPCMVQFITCFERGDNWITMNCNAHYVSIQLPEWQTFDDYLPDWQAAWEQHRKRIDARPDAACTDGAEVNRRLHQATRDLIPCMVQQGRLVPAGTPNDKKGTSLYRMTLVAAGRLAASLMVGHWRAARAVRGIAPVISTPAAQNPAVQLESEVAAFHAQRTQKSTTSASGKWWLFAVSAALFLLVGGLWLSWRFVPILLAVIAIHEAGHYLAMRLTGYRNVSVFFLPGLGGLTTGEKAEATPLEKLFVYLAGPVPGLLMAGWAFWANASGSWAAPAWLNEFLIASLLINYFNLLPFVPLDGGRVLETLVFDRLPRLRFAFGVLCTASLFGLGLLLDDMVLRVVAVLLALSLPLQWRTMRLELAMGPKGPPLDEARAVQHAFATMQNGRFRGWSFAQRSAVATTVLPGLMSRHAHWPEAMFGLVIYAFVVVSPPAIALWKVPHAGSIASILMPSAVPSFGTGIVRDDVDEEPARPPPPPPVDWNARLARITELPPADQLQTWMGAAEEAYQSEDETLAAQHYGKAWELASVLPQRDLRRIAVLQGLADTAEDNSTQQAYLQQIVSALDTPQGEERLALARAKEQLAYDAPSAAGRVALLREVIGLRTGAPTPANDLDNTTRQITRLSLAQALDANGQTGEAEAELRLRIDGIPQPAANDRSRMALQQRVERVTNQVELAWFRIAHGQPEQARAIAQEAQAALPEKITISWMQAQQQVLDVLVWSQLNTQSDAGFRAQWDAYDTALRNGFAGGRTLLFHEIDRALVAQVLNDDAQKAQAVRGIREATAEFGKRPIALCREPLRNALQANWRLSQQQTRRSVLLELGACNTASNAPQGTTP